MSIQIDTCGLSCPQPVLLFLAEAKKGNGPFGVLVDNDASKENVSRAARNHGFDVEARDQDKGVTLLSITKTA